jgi:predicted ATPase
LKLLVTSREALHIRGEHVFSVPPLTVPGADLKQQSLEKLATYEAVQLFVDRASAVRSDFELTKENATTVAGICSRLDGLPLAIELAAARITLFPPRVLLERVGNRLKLLQGGARDFPVRQQTLRGAIDWSYDLLSTEEQRLFALLSVFISCTFEEVEVVAGGIRQLDEMHMDIFDGLGSLLDKNLIRRTDQNSGETRLLMLETIREYAQEQLEKDPEFNAATRRAHAAYFGNFVQLHWKRLTGDERETALREIESDIENVRTAWNYWVEDVNLEQLQKLTDFLWLFYDARGWYYATVGLTTDLLKVLSSIESTSERAQQEILLQTSLARVLMAINGCTPEVEKAYTRALELCQTHGEIPQSFPVMRALAGFYSYTADFNKSADFGKKILNLAERMDDRNMRAEGHLVYGYNLAFLGRVMEGMEHLEKGIALYDPDLRGSQSFLMGNNPGVTSYTTSALCLWMTGSPDRALKQADNAITLAKRLNHPFSLAYALFHTGLLHLWRREFDIVVERTKAALEIAGKYEFQIWEAVATCLQGAALAGIGRAEEGLLEVKRGMDMYTELKTPPVFWPILLMIQAITCLQTGDTRKALILIDEALGIMGQSAGNPILAEFYRLKGDVLLLISQENFIQAEALYRKALDLARQQQTLMFELKTSMSLGKLLLNQGKAEEGRQLLNTAYDKFTEGFSTIDVIEAKELLSDLS